MSTTQPLPPRLNFRSTTAWSISGITALLFAAVAHTIFKLAEPDISPELEYTSDQIVLLSLTWTVIIWMIVFALVFFPIALISGMHNRSKAQLEIASNSTPNPIQADSSC